MREKKISLNIKYIGNNTVCCSQKWHENKKKEQYVKIHIFLTTIIIHLEWYSFYVYI